jgi:hypothetical protein
MKQTSLPQAHVEALKAARRKAARMLGPDHYALDDIVTHVSLALLRKLDYSPCVLLYYAMRIARNEALRYQALDALHATSDFDEAIDAFVHDFTPAAPRTPVEEIEWRELHDAVPELAAALKQVIETVGDKDRTFMVEYSTTFGFDADRYASANRLRTASVKRHFRRVMARLHVTLEKRTKNTPAGDLLEWLAERRVGCCDVIRGLLIKAFWQFGGPSS